MLPSRSFSFSVSKVGTYCDLPGRFMDLKQTTYLWTVWLNGWFNQTLMIPCRNSGLVLHQGQGCISSLGLGWGSQAGPTPNLQTVAKWSQLLRSGDTQSLGNQQPVGDNKSFRAKGSSAEQRTFQEQCLRQGQGWQKLSLRVMIFTRITDNCVNLLWEKSSHIAWKRSATENNPDQSPDPFVTSVFSPTHPTAFRKIAAAAERGCVNRIRFGCHRLVSRMSFALRQTSKWRVEMNSLTCQHLMEKRRKIKCFSGLDGYNSWMWMF